MSLLIKALAQAAKDRDAANSDPAGSDASAGAPADPPRTASSLSLEPPGQRRAAPSLAGLAHIEAQQRSRAAAVVQAGERPTSKVLAYARASPVAMLGALAVLFGIGFGIYVYLQMASPGLLARKPPPPQASAQAPPPATSPAVASAPSAPDTPGASAAALPPPPVTGATGASSSAVAGAGAIPGAAARAGASPAPTAPPPAMSTQIPTASVVPGRDAMERTPERGPGAEPPREPPTARAVDGRQAQPAAPAQSAPAARERIVVSASTQKPTLNPNLSLAYSALQSGDVEQARALYGQVSQAEPLNIDSLLGLAYLAARENRSDDAMKQYLRILQLDPRHALAQAGMISLMGRADPVAAETRLKQIISREPSAFLHFTLGNLYADQSLWSQAQQSYFQAHHLEPDNPDYAYNLAVGLDHLRQTKPALGYYRRAEQLAAARGRANFDVSHARERIGILSSQLQ